MTSPYTNSFLGRREVLLLIFVACSAVGAVVFGRLGDRWLSLAALAGYAASVPRVVFLIAERRRRELESARRGECCVRCGYPTVGADQVQCPECGKVFPVANQYESMLVSLARRSSVATGVSGAASGAVAISAAASSAYLGGLWLIWFVVPVAVGLWAGSFVQRTQR
jgi:hypothetical protein